MTDRELLDLAAKAYWHGWRNGRVDGGHTKDRWRADGAG